jgi:toxin ParE1/3/4
VKRRSVVFSPEARDDLDQLYEWIVGAAGHRIAIAYVERLERFCLGFELSAERGHRRDDLRPGLRIAGFERRMTIAFTVDEAQVTILRLFSKGRNWEDSFE